MNDRLIDEVEAPPVALSCLMSFARSLRVELELSEDSSAIAIDWIFNQGPPGTGAKVMKEILRHADACGKAIVLEALEGHPKLMAYYGRFDFKPWSTSNPRVFGNEWKHGMRREPLPVLEMAGDTTSSNIFAGKTCHTRGLADHWASEKTVQAIDFLHAFLRQKAMLQM